MSNLLSISHSSGYQSRLPALYPAFPLRNHQDTDLEEEANDSTLQNPKFAVNPKWKAIANPKFRVGSLVTIAKDLNPQSRLFPKITAKGWQGRVEEALTDGSEHFFIISLDSITLKELPPKYLKEIVEEGDRDNPFLFEVPEEALEAAAPKDTQAEALQLQRLIYHTHFWGNIKKDAQARRMFQILTRDPSEDDLGNWLYYFQHEVELPIPAEVEGLLLEEIPPGTAVKILGVEGQDSKHCRGLIGSVQKGRVILSYPLMELLPLNEGAPVQQPLSDYRYWADFSLL